MSNLYDKFKTNENSEENGVWVNFGDGIRMKVRRLKSRAAIAAHTELDKPYQNEIRRGSLDPEVNKDLALKQIAKGIIAEWEGISVPWFEGELPYTPENAYKVLKDLPELADSIVAISADADNYKAGVVAGTEGNS